MHQPHPREHLDRPDEEEPNLRELREILLGSRSAQLEDLQRRLDDPRQRSAEMSRVLSEALELRARQDDSLTRVLAQPVGTLLKTLVREDPSLLVDILFPVIGPAIRRAIADALKQMIQRFNRTLEQSFTLRGLKWRFEAWSTGRSFGEVVLLHSLRYSVEEVFLIHGESGLLLEHAFRKSATARDPELVSGMLTAIREFVQDSFEAETHEGVSRMEVSDLTIWIEQGPSAVLAAVVRGEPSEDLRESLQEVLEEIHRRFGEALLHFDGRVAPFEGTRPLLSRCLLEQHQPPRRPILAWTAIASVVALVLALLGWTLVSSAQARARWNDYLARLSDEPGIVVTSTQREGGRYSVQGLRDPSSRDPGALLSASGIAPDAVEFHWKGFLSMEPKIVLARSLRLMDPPDSVQLSLEGETLRVSGSADPDWILRARREGLAIAGVSRIDLSGLREDARHQIALLRHRIESAKILFASGSSVLSGEDQARLARIVEDLQSLLRLSRDLPAGVHFEIIGQSDPLGELLFNRRLRRDRAATVRSALIELGIEPSVLTTTEQGPRSDSGPLASMRSVRFRVLPEAP